jgi:hypothetical protein
MRNKNSKKFANELQQHFTQYFAGVLPNLPNVKLLCTFAGIECVQIQQVRGKDIALSLFRIHFSLTEQFHNDNKTYVGSVIKDCDLCVTGYHPSSTYEYEHARIQSYFQVADIIKKNKRNILSVINQIADKHRSEIYKDLDDYGRLKYKKVY